MEFKNILALAPHTDDIEIGCGGTLNRFKDSNIFVAAFSYAPPVIDGDIKGDFEKVPKSVVGEDIIVEDSQWFTVNENESYKALNLVFSNYDKFVDKSKKLGEIAFCEMYFDGELTLGMKLD